MAAVAAAGFHSVICNRPTARAGVSRLRRDRRGGQAAGLEFRYIPVAFGIGPAEIRSMTEAMQALPQPVVAFCASGARSAALCSQWHATAQGWAMAAPPTPTGPAGKPPDQESRAGRGCSRYSTGGGAMTAQTLSADLLAAVIVTIMLIPQSLAYALLAGLPPEAGLYASIAPIIAYAIFGTQPGAGGRAGGGGLADDGGGRGQVARTGTPGYAAAALTLAALSGGILLVLGLLRLGFIANFLSAIR